MSDESKITDSDLPVSGNAKRTKMDTVSQQNLAMAIGVLGLALAGQYFFSFIKQDLWNGVAFFVVAILLFLFLARRSEYIPSDSPSWLDRARQIIERIRGEPIRLSLVTLSFALVYLAVRQTASKIGGESYWDVFALWVMGSAMYVTAFVRLPHIDVNMWWRVNWREVLMVVGLSTIAALLRFAYLGFIPDVVSGDEGIIGSAITLVLRGDVKNMMLAISNQGALYIFALAGVVNLFGASATTLRVVSAVGGTLNVVMLYIFARYMFNSRVAFIASALMTVSHFHLHFSRIIVASGIQDGLFTTITFYFLVTGLEKRSLSRLVLCGVTVGLFQYVYMGARLIALLMPVVVFVLWIINRRLVLDNKSSLLAALGAMVVVSTPMWWWAFQYPDEYMSRLNQMGIIQSGWLANEISGTGKSAVLILAELITQAFLTVTYYPAAAHYNSSLPMLDFVSSALFILGIAYSLWHTFNVRHLSLQAWFWSGIVVGGALVVVPADNAYRILIIFPVVCVFVGLGLDRVIEFGFKTLEVSAALRNVPVAAFLVVAAFINLNYYFVDYSSNCRYGDWATRYASYMGKYLGQTGKGYNVYLFGFPLIQYGTHPSVNYLSGGVNITNVNDPLSAAPTFVKPGIRSIFFFIPQREKEMDYVQQYMPGGTVERIDDCKAPMLIIYRVDSGALK